MSESTHAHLSIRILDKEYFVACPESERADLLASAAYLNSKMKEIRDTGSVMGADRIAVMAALNMANELLKLRGRDQTLTGDVGARLKTMRERVETVLAKGQQLEL